MSSFPLASFRPQIELKKTGQVGQLSCVPRITTAHIQTFSRPCLKITLSRPKYRQCPPPFVFQDSGNSGDGGQEPLDTPTGDAGRKLSLEEILRQQIEKQEAEGGPPDGGGRGRGRRGRGGGGGGGNSDGSEEESLGEMLNELLQMFLATVGLILLYVYILNGPEITRLTKDYFKFLLTGHKSVRLKRAMYVWGRFCRAMTRKKKKLTMDEGLEILEKQVLTAPTYYDSSAKYGHIVKAYVASRLGRMT